MCRGARGQETGKSPGGQMTNAFHGHSLVMKFRVSPILARIIVPREIDSYCLECANEASRQPSGCADQLRKEGVVDDFMARYL